MRMLRFLVEKEFKIVFRNPLILSLVIFYPILMVAILPLAISFEVDNVRIDVVDHAQSHYSQRLCEKIAASPQFVLSATPSTYQEAMQRLEQNQTEVILEIPANFDTQLYTQHQAQVGVAVNSVNGTIGLLGNSYLQSIMADFSCEIAHELIGTLSQAELIQIQSQPKTTIQPTFLHNPHFSYRLFMVPGFMVMTLTLICGILPALNIVIEKERGTIQQVNVSPISKQLFILAKLIPYWVIGIIIIIISVFFAYIVYGMWPKSNLLLFFLSALIFIISISGLGIIISNYSHTLSQASSLVIFFILILILLSGMFTPISSMPIWAQVIAYLNPYTYILRTFRMLYLHHATFLHILPNLFALLLFAFVLYTWSVLSYRKQE